MAAIVRRPGKSWSGRFPKPGAHCYNVRVKYWSSFFLLLALLLPSVPSFSSEEGGIAEFILKLQNDLSARRVEVYLESFVPELRDAERQELTRYFDSLGMESATLTWANKSTFDANDPRLFLQAVFQNSFAALVETWQLRLENRDDRWLVVEKNIRGSIGQLYKVRLPAERIEKAARVEISHADIKLTFRNAFVFYDNIPGLDTALLVLGDGRLAFSPSNASERHQLEVVYKKKVLEDRVDQAFLHFSTAFFDQNIKVENAVAVPPQEVDANVMKRASAAFENYRSRFYTFETPISPEPLSFLPQGQDASIQFQGRKRGELSYVYSSFAEEEVSLYDVGRERFISLYSPGEEEGSSRLVITFGQKFDVRHCEIELDFEPKSLSISAKAGIDLISQTGRLDSIKLKLNPELEILRIYDEKRRELFFTQDPSGGVFYIYFLEPVAPNALTRLEVLYRGRLKPPSQITDTVAAAQVQELREVPFQYDTYLFSQSALWYPAPLVEDYFTARLKIIVPAEYTAVANGRLIEKGVLNGIQRVTEIDKIGSAFLVFETSIPMKYLSFIVGKLDLTREIEDSIPLAAYAEPQVRAPKRDCLDEAGQILEFYESRFGPFPFENLRIVQRLWMTAGGHSPASFIVLNEFPRVSRLEPGVRARMIGSPRSPVDLTSRWKEYFIAHEIAHQWWGQGVCPARYRDQWLSEGLAQYAALLYLQERYGESAFTEILQKFSQWTERKADWGPITLGSRLSYTDFEAFQAIVYDKAALVLNLLRDLLGDEAFFAGLKGFFRAHKYAAASTGQFRGAMEKASGRDLKEFFRLWFDSHLLPEATVATSIIADESGRALRVMISQLNDSFVFPLWVAWEDEDGTPHREKLVIENRSQEFVIPLTGYARRIKVNPDRACPGKFRVS